MGCGVPSNSVLDLFSVKFRSGRPELVHSLASDGAHVYMQTSQGLFKVGSGYAGTIKVNTKTGSLYFKTHKNFCITLLFFAFVSAL